MKLNLTKELGAIKKKGSDRVRNAIEGKINEHLSFFDLTPLELVSLLFEAQAALTDKKPDPLMYPCLVQYATYKQTLKETALFVLDKRVQIMNKVSRLRKKLEVAQGEIDKAESSYDVKHSVESLDLSDDI